MSSETLPNDEPTEEVPKNLSPEDIQAQTISFRKKHKTAFAIANLLIGAGIVGLIIWKTPILDILLTAFWMVFIPLAFLTATGMVGSGIWDLIPTREQIKFFYDKLRSDDSDLSGAATTA